MVFAYVIRTALAYNAVQTLFAALRAEPAMPALIKFAIMLLASVKIV